MTITNGYTTLATVRSLIGIPATDTSSDSLIEASIEAVSRLIDNYTGRRFYVAEETRAYTPITSDEVWVDDVTSITSLKSDDNEDGTYEVTWQTTDYNLLPYNASISGKPYTRIETSGYGNYEFSITRRSLQVVGAFGYCTTSNLPKPVAEAAKIQSVRIFKRKDLPYGVVGGGEMAQPVSIPELDPDVKTLLDPYRKRL